MVPKVSIIIPCYNSEKWIETCVKSALNQSYPNVEVIFVDNESEDKSVEVVEKIKEDCKDFGRTLIMSSAKNIYPFCWDEPRSEGFKLATGDYFLTMGSDDYIHTDFVSNCMQYIMHDPEKVLAFQSPIRGVQSDTGLNVGDIGHKYTSLQEFKTFCLTRCPVPTPTVIFNRKLYDEGLLETRPEQYSGAADYDLYCSLADNGVFIYPAPMWVGYYYRWHEDQATWNMHKQETNYDKKIQEFWAEKWKT